SVNLKSEGILQATLEAREGTVRHRFPCAAMVRQFISQAIRGHRSRSSAARIWNLAVGLRSPSCGTPNLEVLPDKRSHQGQDPLWNYNPTIRFPFIPESFDWSVPQTDGVFTTPAVNGGVRFHFKCPSSARHPVILLARPLPQPEVESELAITTQWEQLSPNACAGSLTWELRDAAGVAIFGRASLKSGTALPHPSDQASTETVNLDLSAGASGLQLVLVHYPAAQTECRGDSLAIRSVVVQPHSLRSGKARPAPD
ncbi:MAG: hypothetical protein KIT83_21740, partial [Bryobacterales bacterium]|nr:hypothetical protein [Bryobacterales bacterium]